MNAKPRGHRLNRRQMLQITGGVVLGNALGAPWLQAASSTEKKDGVVVGEPTAAIVGEQILAEGGNAIDAIIAAAFAAAVVSPQNCGVGGYGTHMVLALAKGRKVVSIDGNSTAPAAARPDMFPLDDKGGVRGRVNSHGWLAAGVPGIPAALQLGLERYGTRTLREILAPAIRFARDGFKVGAGTVLSLRGSAVDLRKDAASVRLLFPNGAPLKEGEIFRNPELAALLQSFADHNSVDSFYRGDVARKIAEAFQKNGGLVTEADLAAYRAREVEPLQFSWHGGAVFTAPLTAGGLSILQALQVLKAMDWDKLPPDVKRAHAQLEALRIAWSDRLQLLGDPEKSKVPVEKLLSPDYAKESARKVQAAVKAGKPVPLKVASRFQDGTVNLSSVDRDGNMAALTLTHGAGFGARVTVDGLGLTLGHGMSRFEPFPGHPNSPAPGKKPLHNMCPTVVLRDGHPVLALGGAGGRKIPNAIFDVLTRYVVLGETMEPAVAAPREHTEGTLALTLEKAWPAEEAEYFKSVGYDVKTGPSAKVSATAFDPATKSCRGVSR